MKKYFLVLFLTLSLMSNPLWAVDAFVVKKIEIRGSQRISSETVYTYLPIHTGETYHPGQSVTLIRALYKTGFFQHISLEREGNVLIVNVVERPTIGQLKITGNRVIPTDKLTDVMKKVDVVEGRTFDRAMLDRIRQSLLAQYYQLGRYNARVDVTITPMERNRVSVKIDISEGLVAVIRRINIIGNHAFSQFELEKQLEISTPGLFSYFTDKDKFSQEKVDASLEALRNFYLNHGYIRFIVKSSQVEVTPDRKSIYVTIVIDEGDVYHVSGFNLEGDFVVPKATLMPLVKIKPGDIFSRKEAIDSEKAISDVLGDRGYIFATFSLSPVIDDSKKEVFLTFHITPGKLIYVNHIYFSNNTKTNDEGLRHYLTQMEGGVISASNLEQSKHKLSILPYIKDVQMAVEPVPDKDDQVDVNYKVTEDSAAQATFTIGYSQVEHLLLNIGFNQKNFLGTGETLGLNASRSKVAQNYAINFMDPYYTLDGVTRSVNFSISKFNPANANLSRSYTTDEYNAAMVYGIPVGQEKTTVNTLQLGYGYQSTLLDLTNSLPSNQVLNFVNNHGRHFQQLNLIGGYTRDGRDKDIFPTSGALNNIGLNLYLPLSSRSLKYYTATYEVKSYFPLTQSRRFILTAKGTLGYGNGYGGTNEYPFFKDFYAGGIDSVRGYEGNTLGPKDNVTNGGQYGNSTGGNALVSGALGLVFPNYISDSLRTTAFIDAGNVYNTFDNRKYGGTGSGPIRFATGLQFDWLSPMGMISFDVAKPLNTRPGDDVRIFDFSLGANFG